jgi:hypothetical protein
LEMNEFLLWQSRYMDFALEVGIRADSERVDVLATFWELGREVVLRSPEAEVSGVKEYVLYRAFSIGVLQVGKSHFVYR